jgi:hypothetical protein
MRVQELSTANAGMTRLRTKGNAAPNTLYDLLNGYITLSGTIKPRPGSTLDISLPADTAGLVSHKCRLYVFKHEPDTTSNPDKYVVAVLRHPTDPTQTVAKIHFASPFMGFLYVAAEFSDGNVWHYWLEELDPWSPNTDYVEGDRVFPTTENGYAYRAKRPGSPNPAWQPSTRYELNDVVEPTVANGFKYTAVSVTGDPVSGDVEPTWPEQSGGQVIEYASGIESTVVTTSTVQPSTDTGAGTYYDGYDISYLGGGFRAGSYTVKLY